MNTHQDQDDDSENESMTIKRKKMIKKQPNKPDPNEKSDPILEKPSSLWDKEDPCEEINQNAASLQNPSQSYDLKKGIKLSVSADRNIIQCSKTQAQKLSTVISLRTLEVTSQENQVLDELNPSDNRLPIDLIAVIDCSGSMQGEKIRTVKEALKILLPFFSDKDRLSIVAFESNARKVMSLKRMNAMNMPEIINVIDSKLKAAGSTSIPAGINEAVRIIKNRENKNKIVSVFVLSDGNDNDNNAATTIKNRLSVEASGEEFTIHTFGFGDDHDSVLLSEICKLRNGNFYYIQNLEKINECFVNAFGGLLSIVGREAYLKISLEKTEAAKEIKELSDMKWLKAYGDFWKLNQLTNDYEIDIQNLINGMKTDYVIDLQIPRIISDIIANKREQILLTCVLTAKNIENDDLVITKAHLKAKFYQEEEEFKNEPNQELNAEVVVNLFRVQVGEVLENAIKLAQASKNDEALKEIDLVINKILVSKHAKSVPMQRFIEQLENAKENCKPHVFNDYGKHALINDSEVTMKQRGMRAIKHKKEAITNQNNNNNCDSDSDPEENTIQRTMKRKMKKKAQPNPPQQQENAPLGLSTVVEKSNTLEQTQNK